MIVIHVDSMEDTAPLKKAYAGLEHVKLLYNPSKEEVIGQLERDDDPLVMCLGHGNTDGLFAANWLGHVVDRDMIDLLKGRKMIGIWCYASSFAELYGLHGYFTSMFISNWDEAYSLDFPDNTNEDILNEADLFCEKINAFLKEGIPMEQWVDLLQAGCHKEKDFVRFNYEGMRWLTNSKEQYELGKDYFDGEKLEQDYAKAVYWYTKAALQGDPYAQCDLGYCYAKGFGVEQDQAKAAEW